MVLYYHRYPCNVNGEIKSEVWDVKRFYKHARRLMGILLCGCLLVGGFPLSGLPAAAQAEETVLELEEIYTGGDAELRGNGEGFSGGFVFINTVSGSGVGKTAQFALTVPAAGTYDLTLTEKGNTDRGIYGVDLDGRRIATVDFYNVATDFYTHSLGRVTFSSTTAALTLTCVGANEASSGKFGLAADYITLTPVEEDDSVTITTSDEGYTESDGSWSDGEEAGTRVTQDAEATAMWASYPPSSSLASPNYDVLAYIPQEGEGTAVYTIRTLSGRWEVTLDQSTAAGGWYKLATVSAPADTSVSVTLQPQEGSVAAGDVKITATSGVVDAMAATDTPGGDTTVYVRVNQIGYDTDKSKRATVVNVADGTPFAVRSVADDSLLYTGAVQGGIADFTAYQPEASTSCYLECQGVRSYDFTIAKYLMQQASVENALDFMEQSRADAFEMGQKGIGWRDSHQFSFEMSSLVLQYMANPSLYDQMEYDVYKADECEYEELRVQDEPNIVWLMEFAALRYYDLAVNDGKKLHMLIKEQLAWFLYAYPFISQYVPEDMYIKIRDLTISIWGESGCNLSYHQVDGTNYYNLYDPTNNKEDNNLFTVQKVIGGIKGQLPPGHAIAPNLMMYEVLTRDGIDGADAYFQAAYDNCAWIVEEIDIGAPEYSKGQRMSEHVVMENLAFFLEEYPDRAPEGLRELIAGWAQTMVARADNLWDMRMASSTAAGDEYDCWTGAAYADASGQWENCTMNEPGSAAGLQAAMYAACRVLGDDPVTERLQQIGISAIDDVFGRNPHGRAFFYNGDFLEEFEGADLGWFSKYNGGNGVLANVTGRLDASPKEAAYANESHCNPSADPGYTEAWVAYNTAWNSSLAYAAAADVQLTVSAAETAPGQPVTVTLKAPLNMDSSAVETGQVRVTNRTTGETQTLTLTENSADDYSFSGQVTVDNAGDVLEVAYGYGLFEQMVTVTATGEPAPTVTLGDVNEDGQITAADALLVLQAATGKINLNQTQQTAADVDADGSVVSLDALLTLQYATGKIKDFGQ